MFITKVIEHPRNSLRKSTNQKSQNTFRTYRPKYMPWAFRDFSMKETFYKIMFITKVLEHPRNSLRKINKSKAPTHV